MDVSQTMTVLKQNAVFNDMEDSLLDTLIFLGYSQYFSPGYTIYTKGEPSNGRFGVILSGSVNIVKHSGDILKVVGSGDIIGEIALSEPHRKRTMTVTAVESTEILEWDVNHVIIFSF